MIYERSVRLSRWNMQVKINFHCNLLTQRAYRMRALNIDSSTPGWVLPREGVQERMTLKSFHLNHSIRLENFISKLQYLRVLENRPECTCRSQTIQGSLKRLIPAERISTNRYAHRHRISDYMTALLSFKTQTAYLMSTFLRIWYHRCKESCELGFHHSMLTLMKQSTPEIRRKRLRKLNGHHGKPKVLQWEKKGTLESQMADYEVHQT